MGFGNLPTSTADRFPPMKSMDGGIRAGPAKCFQRWQVLAIVLFAFLLRAAALYLFTDYYAAALAGQGEMRNIAISLATTGDFADPYGQPTGKTAHLAPIGPFLVSLIYRGFGISRRAEVVRGVACALTSALVCGLTLLLGLELGLDRRVALLASVFAAIAPTGVQFYSDLTEQDACLGTLFFACALVAFPWDRAERSTSIRAVVFGVASGLAVLSYQSLLAPIASVLLCGIVFYRRPPRRHFSVVAASVLCLVILPWSVRNRLVFHEWVLIRSNFGLEFRMAQHPMGDQLGATLRLVHPYGNPATLALVRQIGEPSAYRKLLNDGLQWIYANPAVFVRRTICRVVWFWIPVGLGLYRTLASLIFTTVAWVGVKALIKTRPATGMTVASVWVTYPLVYYLVPGYARYRQPIEFTIYLMAALGMFALFGRPGLRRQTVAGVSPRTAAVVEAARFWRRF
jgi:hypothetical protein